MRKLIILFTFLFTFTGLQIMPAAEKMNIEIICFGRIENYVLDYLKKNLTKIFNAEVSIGSLQDLPKYAYRKKRNQYLASVILDRLAKPKSPNQKILAIIDKQLYVLKLNFVFGLADFPKGVCIISLGRLYQSFYGLREDRDLFLKRSLKEAVHEIGHLLNLVHCPDPACVMYFSNSLLDTDRKDYRFCVNCQRRLPQK